MVRLLIVFGADPTLATYGGLSPEKIAHSDKMRSLITGMLQNVHSMQTPMVVICDCSFFFFLNLRASLFEIHMHTTR